MDINNLIISDEALKVIDEGTWVGDFAEAPGVELLVTGLKADAAKKAINDKQRSLRTKQRGRELSGDQLEKITKEVLYEVILKDWRGLKNNGQELKYSKEQAKKWITSRNGEKFTEIVLQAAQRVDAEAQDYVEEVKKTNCPPKMVA